MSRRVLSTTSSTSTALSLTLSMGDAIQFIGFTVTFDSAPTTSENLVLTLDAAAGAAYDTVLYSDDPSTDSTEDYWFYPDSPQRFKEGDALVLTYTNTDTRAIGAQIYYDLNPRL